MQARIVLGLIVAASLSLGWHLRWLLDDAFISFRYARNLVEGHGLVFNPGESPPVEGYTNFLWTVLMAVPIGLGFDPTYPALAVDMACGAATLIVTWWLARRVLGGHRVLALLVVALLAFNYTFLCFLTTGLETGLYTCLITLGLTLALRAADRGWSRRDLIGLSLCGAAAVLTRMDTAVPGVITLAWALLRMRTKAAGRDEWRRRLTALLVPGGVVVGAWLAWKLNYYGDLLPNTWYARDVGLDPWLQWSRGVRFVVGFVTDYWLWPFLLLALGSPALWRRTDISLLISVVLAWFAYVIHTGAGYMEYRFMVSILPALLVVLVAAVSRLHRFAPAAAAVVLLAASLAHGLANDGTPLGHGRVGPRELGPETHPTARQWNALRELVGRYPGADDLLWTLPALGAASYYSRFRVVDLHGLTDRWVARNGRVRDEAPGHDKFAPLSYLEQRGVALADSFGDPCYWYNYYGSEELADKHLVRIDRSLFLSVTHHPVVDRIVAGHGARIEMPTRSECGAHSERRSG